jgi:hypothetical protein
MSLDAETVKVSVPKALTKHAREMIEARFPDALSSEVDKCVTAYVMGYMDFLLVQHRVFSGEGVGAAQPGGPARGVS